jgi:hypothetical protein
MEVPYDEGLAAHIGPELCVYARKGIREPTSVGCFVARKLAEPILGGKANEATYVSHAPSTKMGFGCQCVSQR